MSAQFKLGDCLRLRQDTTFEEAYVYGDSTPAVIKIPAGCVAAICGVHDPEIEGSHADYFINLGNFRIHQDEAGLMEMFGSVR